MPACIKSSMLKLPSSFKVSLVWIKTGRLLTVNRFEPLGGDLSLRLKLFSSA